MEKRQRPSSERISIAMLKNYTSFLGEESKGNYSLARKAQSIWVVFVVTNEDPSLTSRDVSVK